MLVEPYADPHSMRNPRNRALLARLLSMLLPAALCYQASSCSVSDRNSAGGAIGGFGRIPALPGFGQPFVQQTPILQPGGIGIASGGPP